MTRIPGAALAVVLMVFLSWVLLVEALTEIPSSVLLIVLVYKTLELDETMDIPPADLATIVFWER